MRTRSAAALLAVVLVSYTLQTELASHVQHGLGYKKPYFLFYLTHSSYLLLFPLHLVVLAILPATRSAPSVPALLAELAATLEEKFQPPSGDSDSGEGGRAAWRVPPSPKPYQHVEHRSISGFLLAIKRTVLVRVREPWVDHLAKRVLLLTVLISAPALSWYGAVPLTSMTDITAIYNVFAFWAYLLSLYYLPAPAGVHVSPLLRLLNFVAVLLAVSGVFVIAYGDAVSSGSGDEEGGEGYDAKSRLLGNALALFGSVAYAAYEVWYKLRISLPESSDETPLQDLPHQDYYEAAPSEDAEAGPSAAKPTSETETSSLLRAPSPLGGNGEGGAGIQAATMSPSNPGQHPVHEDADEADDRLSPLSRSRRDAQIRYPPPGSTRNRTVSPSLLLLYSNAITSLIGLATVLLLWIPIPLLNWIGWEEFEVPPSSAGLAMVGIILGGIVFNGGFMVLLSLWGPVTASVANLLTLLLVSLCDALFVPSAPPMTRSTLAGGGMIVCAFAVLIAAEMRGESGAAGEKEGETGETADGDDFSRRAPKGRLGRISEEEGA